MSNNSLFLHPGTQPIFQGLKAVGDAIYAERKGDAQRQQLQDAQFQGLKKQRDIEEAKQRKGYAASQLHVATKFGFSDDPDIRAQGQQIFDRLYETHPLEMEELTNGMRGTIEQFKKEEAERDTRTAFQKNYGMLQQAREEGRLKDAKDMEKSLGLREDPKLSPTMEKHLLETQSNRKSASERRYGYVRLANALNNTSLKSGAAGKIDAAWRKFVGSEDERDLIIKEITRLRNKEVIANLPAGPASDRDIQILMDGFLDPYANPQTQAAYMRGAAKAQAIQEAYYRAEAAFISKNKTTVGFSAYWEDNAERIATAAIKRVESKLRGVKRKAPVKKQTVVSYKEFE